MEVKPRGLNKCVLYLRISDKAQERKGSGLASQEACCREYARFKGYEVEDVFREVLTGGSQDRPAMSLLLSYLRKHKREGRIVIIDDISRFARDIRGHWLLREELSRAGGVLESPRIKFADDADSVFNENILASVAQHQRQKNAEQTKNRMRGRVLNGYWPFNPCVGYRHVRKPGEGMVLVRDEPAASVVQEALEGYASGRFQIQAEVMRFLNDHPSFPKPPQGQVTNQMVKVLLARILYAGYVEAPRWGIPAQKGRHEGLISMETYERIQARLKGGAYAPARANIRDDFPLRGVLACAHCGKPLTGYYCGSKTGRKHPYYMCFAKGCDRYRKSYRRDQVEGDFERLLEALTPRQQLFDLALAMFKDAWSQRSDQALALAHRCRAELATIQKQIDGLVDRVVNAGSDAIVAAYEKRIIALERSKAVMAERASRTVPDAGTFSEKFELAIAFLSSPSKIWKFGDAAQRRLVLRLTFSERLRYCPENGFRTPKTALPFKVLDSFRDGGEKMARPKGFEPLTPRFVVWCSIQLSYGRAPHPKSEAPLEWRRSDTLFRNRLQEAPTGIGCSPPPRRRAGLRRACAGPGARLRGRWADRGW